MNPIIRNALVIGGGIGGMCAAIELSKHGIAVDLIELRPDGAPDGAGITISSATLRALRQIGVVNEVLAHAGHWNFIDLCTSNGHIQQTLPMKPAVGAEDLPCAAAVMRPVLARILSKAAQASGVQVRLGIGFEKLIPDADGVEVIFTDGETVRYDLVVGADGIHSKVRSYVKPNFPGPIFTGQGSWRAVVPRTRRNSSMFLGKHIKAGLNPVSETESYLFVLDRRDEVAFIEAEHWPRMLADLLIEFDGGPLADIRRGLQDNSLTHHACLLYRPLAGHMVRAPWHLGRIVLLGDAVHATTPHLASGAGIAIEGAVILGQELRHCHSIENALSAYAERHYDRARLVVSASGELGRIERDGLPREQHRAIMLQAMEALLAPI